MSEDKVQIGTEGIALEDIPAGGSGDAYFPSLTKRATVNADQNIGKYRWIIIVGANNTAKEYKPYDEGYVYDDFKQISFTSEETSYEIGDAAHQADEDVPKFEAKYLLLRATQQCKIRFNESDRVQHTIPANLDREFKRRCTKIYVVRDTTDGVLTIYAFG